MSAPSEKAGKPVVLVTGFGPTREHADPSGAILRQLAADPPASVRIHTQLLPADPEGALMKAIEMMDHLLPDAVLGLGLAEGETGLCVERVAINLDERDNPARVPGGRGAPIDAAGPAAYFSTLPVHAILERIKAGGVQVRISNSAGTRLSNRLFYALLHYVALRGQETWFKRRPPAGLVSRVGFVRVPAPPPSAAKSPPEAAPGQSARARLDLQGSLQGVRLAVEAVAAFLKTQAATSSHPTHPGE